MNKYNKTPDGRDPELWKIACKRAEFKNHLMKYVIINCFFWGVWFFTGGSIQNDEYLPWPVWPMFGWGIGLFFHFVEAYIYPQSISVEKEYQKLKTKN